MIASREATSERIVAEARRLGFDAVGIARADLPLDDDFARYEAFVDEGMHGGMGWLAVCPRGAAPPRRRRRSCAGAKSVICVARRYGRSAEDEAERPRARAVDRALRARPRLPQRHCARSSASSRARAHARAPSPAEARPLCDEEPILERAWAARAGLGFVGKNGLLIVPGVGSLVLLGEVVTTLELEPDPPIPERCGACTRCLDACPTQAFAQPFVLDPRRCVAYLTIEHRDAIARARCARASASTSSAATTARPSARSTRASRQSTGATRSSIRASRPIRAGATSRSPISSRSTTTDSCGSARGARSVARPASASPGTPRIVIGNRGRSRGSRRARARTRRRTTPPIVRDAAAWAIARIECPGDDA